MVEVKHVDLPQEMQRAMAKQAEAEREKRAKIIHAEGEFAGVAAARRGGQGHRRASPVTIQLRYLQTLTEIATEKNSTIVFPLPIEDAGGSGRQVGGLRRGIRLRTVVTAPRRLGDMAPSYYVIELTGRWLTILLVALALVMVLAFAFGYGAAWSVLSDRLAGPPAPVVAGGSTPTPTPAEVVIPVVAEDPTPAAPTRAPTEAPLPATPTPKPKPTQPPAATAEAFWVQVLASGSADAVEEARERLAGLGFPGNTSR